MKVDETVRRGIWHYPHMFPNRIHMLHHMFYVLGCGYEWVDGELVDGWVDDEGVRHSSYDELTDEDAYWDHEKYPRGRPYPEYDAYVDLVRSEIDERVHNLDWDMWVEGNPRWQGGRHPYPRSQWGGTNINNIPADCKPDWLHAAWQAVTVIEPLYDTIGDMAQQFRKKES